MKHCPICSSDDLYQSSSTPLRLMGAFVLVFVIPYGIFFAWIPLIMPHAFLCRRCGNETKEEDLKPSDWRERNTWIEKEKKQGALLTPLNPLFFRKFV